MKRLILAFILIPFLSHAEGQENAPLAASDDAANAKQASEICKSTLGKLPGKSLTKWSFACEKVQVLETCQSAKGVPIYHYEKSAQDDTKAKNILVFSLIHGDEVDAGTVAKLWMDRLENLEARNHWRIVPVLNPDGFENRTRTNANKVDINRNFPTKDWSVQALKLWKSQTNSNPRRFPGEVSASESETRCAMKHLEEFNPDFVVSVHTPLRVLDFDGPKVKKPNFDYLPWKTLGHFPGSLGRYMWHERSTPVLTMELKETLPARLDVLAKLQDIVGTLVDFENGKSKKEKSVTFAAPGTN
jgi:murein peptide amidase A